MTGGPWTQSMKVVHGPGPKWGSMDPWSTFCPHPLDWELTKFKRLPQKRKQYFSFIFYDFYCRSTQTGSLASLFIRKAKTSRNHCSVTISLCRKPRCAFFSVLASWSSSRDRILQMAEASRVSEVFSFCYRPSVMGSTIMVAILCQMKT